MKKFIRKWLGVEAEIQKLQSRIIYLEDSIVEIIFKMRNKPIIFQSFNPLRLLEITNKVFKDPIGEAANFTFKIVETKYNDLYLHSTVLKNLGIELKENEAAFRVQEYDCTYTMQAEGLAVFYKDEFLVSNRFYSTAPTIVGDCLKTHYALRI